MLFDRTHPKVKLFGIAVPEPRVLIDFLGFEKHLVQIRAKRGTTIWPGWFDHAAYYSVDLPVEKIFGPGDVVTIPEAVKAPDYEFEIGCLVLKQGMPTTMDEAIKFFRENCYLTILNDWSARDIQKKDMEGLGPTNSKFVIGKSIGPKFVPASNYELDANGVFDMALKLTFNGQLRTETNYNTIYHTHPQTGAKSAWTFPRVMSWLAQQNIAMQPGYLLGSGTVGNGCIAEFSAKMDPKTNEVLEPALYPWLKEGDVVTMEAEGIGILENKVRVGEYAKAR